MDIAGRNEFVKDQLRLATSALYPASASKCAIMLANTGFQYIGDGTNKKVRCVFCGIVKDKWDPDETVEDVHHPACPMVNVEKERLSEAGTDNNEVLNSDSLLVVNFCPRNTKYNEQDGARPPTANEANHLVDSGFGISNPDTTGSNQHLSDTFAEGNQDFARNHFIGTSCPTGASRNNIIYNTGGQALSQNRDCCQQENVRVSSTVLVPSYLPYSNIIAPSTLEVNSSKVPSTLAVNLSTVPSALEFNLTTVSSTLESSLPTGNTVNELPQAYQTHRISSGKPENIQYAMLENRMASFLNCPEVLSPIKDTLAKAGFFYTGESYNRCRCFFCGKGFDYWPCEHDPFVEHVLRSTNCLFIRQYLGQDVCTAVLELATFGTTTTLSDVVEHMESTGQVMRNDSAASITEKAVIASFIGTNFSSDCVRDAVRKLTQTGYEVSAANVLWLLKREEDQADCNTDINGTDTDRISTLQSENSTLRNNFRCKICMHRDIRAVFIPCGHTVSCGSCSVLFQTCPVCSREIEQIKTLTFVPSTIPSMI